MWGGELWYCAGVVITSTDNPKIKAVVKLREHRERRRTGLFIAEGLREVERALAAGLTAVTIYVTESTADPEIESFANALIHGVTNIACDITRVSDRVMAKMAYRDRPEGVLGVFEQPRWSLDDVIQTGHASHDVPMPEEKFGGISEKQCEEQSGEARVGNARGMRETWEGMWGTRGGMWGGRGMWLVAVGLAKPGNLGAMARTTAAAGASGLIVADGVVDAFNPNAIRASTGAVFGLPIIAASSDDVINRLKSQNIRLFAAALTADAMAYTQASMLGPIALAIGPEDVGLPQKWLDAADQCVVIDMAGTEAGGSTKAGHTTTGPSRKKPKLNESAGETWEGMSEGKRGKTCGRGAVDSLNASVAAGILLFEAKRQRQACDERRPSPQD